MPAARREQSAQVAERIRLARRLSGLTQEDAARGLDVTVRTYARWENGETSGFLGELERIAKLYGTTAEQLLGDGEQDQAERLEEKVDEVLAELAELKALVSRALAV